MINSRVLQRGIILFTRVNVAQCFYTHTVCYIEVSFHLLVSMQHNAFTLCVIERQHFIYSCQCSTLLLHPMIKQQGVIERYHFVYSCQCSTMLLHCVLQRGIISFTRVNVAQCFYTVCYREVSFHLLLSMQHNAFTLCVIERYHFVYSCQCSTMLLHCVLQRGIISFTLVNVAQCFYAQ